MFALRLVLLTLACVAALGAAPQQAHAQPTPPPLEPNDRLRLQRLHYHLSSIRDDAAFDRRVLSGALIGVGAPLTLFALFKDIDYLLPGSLLLVPGALSLSFPSEEEDATRRFLVRSERGVAPPGHVPALVAEGEFLLRDLARLSRRARYIAGSIHLGVGLISTAFYVRSHSTTDREFDVIPDSVALGVPFYALAAYCFLVTNEAEDARDAYQEDLKAMSPGARPTGTSKLRLVPSLMPQGGGLAASLTW